MIDQLKQAKLVAVVRKLPGNRIIEAVEAVRKGGIHFVEVTLDAKDACEQIKALINHFGDTITVGAGTVLSVVDAKRASDAGAAFLVSPHFDADILAFGKAIGKPVFPGTLTPSEMQTAVNAGAEMIKVFPAGTLGAGYIKNIKGPLAHVEMMATGGIDLDNVALFLKAGVSVVGLGSQLISRARVDQGDFAGIEETASAYVKIVEAHVS
ncbi:2-keto-3-deoxy-phosphogluconate aldolase [Streptohalobacillus salinus]|uniref:2-keto-3-deoxy-phosphogluconate aldolase n=1 Tax=Streptohalobacillus salinus TaxID=621096 RepID=A0A2V3WCP9_9BACI|nr:bifunctional 4-hydroxy-2-oxoglutarate aldolase/2-dehydro-3-deoxy-phosphogluconate aldolase [Streptohalobacillus salinus]PXW90918.1 2-keto-3-deoxy-phosphogluconate aldolase [Streptohalobacillus salinus]